MQGITRRPLSAGDAGEKARAWPRESAALPGAEKSPCAVPSIGLFPAQHAHDFGIYFRNDRADPNDRAIQIPEPGLSPFVTRSRRTAGPFSRLPIGKRTGMSETPNGFKETTTKDLSKFFKLERTIHDLSAKPVIGIGIAAIFLSLIWLATHTLTAGV
jgi:hypothetical protein